MRILFIIQGEGRGHLTQALALRQKLTAEGHQIVGVCVGKSPVRRLPTFFEERIGRPVQTFDSPNFLPAAGNKRVKLGRSILYNLFRLPRYVASIGLLRRTIRETEADVIVNFYELMTGLTYLFFRPKTPVVCIAHQYLFLHPDFVFPRRRYLEIGALRFFTRLTAIGSVKKLALSFRKMREVPDRQIVVVPPLLRREVLETQPESGDYLHGYLLNSGFAEEVLRWHSLHPAVPLHFFWDKKGVGEEKKVDSRLTFHPLDDTLFVKFMAGAKAYATTAGFESVCEAMYLGKPVLMIPTHIEQVCNALDASRCGAGARADCFDLDILLQLANHHRPDPTFRDWVRQADWLILREFRSDVLQDALSLPPIYRLMSWGMKRWGKYFSGKAPFYN